MNLFPIRRPNAALAVVMFVLGALLGPGAAHAERPAPLSAQTLKMPNGPSSLKGLGESFSANAATGTGSYSVPIQLPGGFVAPQLRLVYTGGRGRGELGIGFALPLLQVYRQTDKGLPSFSENDRFAVSGPDYNDELVPVDATRKRFRLKNEGAFLLFERDSASDRWIVHQPNGVKSYLGETVAARGLSLGRTTRWYVERVQDPFAHALTYRYMKDGGRVYLSGFDYQLEAAAAYRNKVDFTYEMRPDPSKDFSYGDEVTLAYRLSAIEVRQGTRVLRRYALAYDASLLWSALSEVRMDGEQGLALPTLRLSYLQNNARSGRFVRTEGFASLTDFDTGRMTLEDVNGDGLPDLLDGSSLAYKYYENVDGVRFASNPVQLGVSGSPDRNLDDTGVVLADVDGDGYRDLWYPVGNQFRFFPGGSIQSGRFNGFGAMQLLNANSVVNDVTSSDIRLTDLNGDGRTDLLRQRTSASDVWIENSAQFGLTQYTIPTLPAGVKLSDPNVELADFNGDGTLDLILKEFDNSKHNLKIWYGLGSGRYRATVVDWAAPTAFPNEVRLLDVNRDGQLDFVRISGSWVGYWLNDGRGSYAIQQGDFRGMPSMSRTKRVLLADMNGNGTTDVVWLSTEGGMSYLDLMEEPNAGLLARVDNGMGQVTDISYRSSTSYLIDAKLKGEPWKTPLPFPVPVISEVATGDSFRELGLSSSLARITYDYRDGYYDGKEREFRGFARVTTTEHGDDFQHSRVTELHVHVGRNLETGADEEALKGRPWLEAIRDETGQLIKTTESHLELRYLCQEALPTGTARVLPDCAPFADKQLNKDKLVCLTITSDELIGYWEGTSTPRYTAEKRVYDGWGNPSRVESYGEVSLSTAHQPGEVWTLSELVTSTGNDEVTRETDIANDVTRWLVGFPYQTRTKDGTGAIVAQDRTYYDGTSYVGLPLGQVERGRSSRVERWLAEGARWVATERHAYNADGLSVGSLDATGNLRESAYDPLAKLLPTEERIVLDSGRKLAFVADYDRGYDALVSFGDANGNTIRYRYDGLGRLSAVIDPLASDLVPVTKYSYQYGTPEYPISTCMTEQLADRASADYRRRVDYWDGLGRLRLTKNEDDSGSGVVASGYQRFGARQTAAQAFDPFRVSGWGFELPPANVPVKTTLRDAVGRTLREYLPSTAELGSTFRDTRYLPLEVQSFDERDSTQGTFQYPAVSRMDGLGRVRRVDRKNVAGAVITNLSWQMTYDALGQLRTFLDSKGNLRNYGYDSLGRLKSISDPNFGQLQYTYDDGDRLLTRGDSLGQVMQNTYGPAGRVAKQAYWTRRVTGTEPPDFEHIFHYDLAQPSGPLGAARNLSGQLSWVEYPTGTDHFSYDERGRLESEARSLWDGVSPMAQQLRTTHVRKIGLNGAGEETWRELSGGVRLESQRGRRGLIAKLTARLPDSTSRDVLAQALYDARGLTSETRTGNDVRTCQDFNARAQLSGSLVGKAPSISCSADAFAQTGLGAQHLAYAWGYDGLLDTARDLSVDQRANGISRLDASYSYDRLHQLSAATLSRQASADEAWEYSYDEIQNLTKRKLTRRPVPSGPATVDEQLLGYGVSAGPNAATSVTKSGASVALPYDAVGQLKSYNGYDLTFDPAGRLTKARKGTKTIEYYYDAWGERKLLITREGSVATHVFRYPFDSDEERDGVRVLRFDAAATDVEVALGVGLKVDATLLAELELYVAAPAGKPNPLPQEYLDLDGDGDGFDAGDLAVARTAFWANRPAGPNRSAWRYTHRDHLGSSSVVTDGSGDAVSTRQYDPYGGTAQRKGLQPAFGFSGTKIEPDEDLGLVQMGSRYYVPALGRWASSDRFIGESPRRMLENPLESNLFSFARNSVTSRWDPSGRQSTPPPAAGGDASTPNSSTPDPSANQSTNQSPNPNASTPQASLPPECQDLLTKIVERIAELTKRYNDLLEDKRGLPPTGPMSIKGHQDQFVGKQKNLTRMVDQWNNNQCGPGLPVETEEWQTVPTPSPRPKVAPPAPVTPTPIVDGQTVQRVAETGAIVGTGYIVYRIVRMIPSLFVPPTIIPNLAIP